MKKTLLFIAFSILLNCYSQNFPVQITAQLNPPNTLNLPEYSTNPERISLQLLNKDFTNPEIDVYLKIKIEGQGITIQSKTEFIPLTTQTLSAGIPTILNGTDISEQFNISNLAFSNYTPDQLQKRGGNLPEGFYTFSFTVYSRYRHVPVSNTATVSAGLFKHLPPLINLPSDNSFINTSTPQSLIIQFTPRHTASAALSHSVRYKIRIVEIIPGNRNANEVMQSTTIPLFEAVTEQTFFAYGPGDPQLTEGRAYALQIQAFDVDGKDYFENDGYSSVVKFTYGRQCESPIKISLRDTISDKATIIWDRNTFAKSYIVYHKQKKEKDFHSTIVLSESCELSELKRNEIYEVKVTSVCAYNESEPSDILQFKSSKGNGTTAEWNQNCGKSLPVFDLTNNSPLILLQAGETIEAADFKIKILAVEGSNGIFTGNGIVTIPFTGRIPLPCTFNHIQINSDKRVTGGKITILNKPLEISGTTLCNLANQWGDYFGENWNRYKTINYKGSISSITLDPSGKITINNSPDRKISTGENLKIKDKDGNIFFVSEGGVITEAEGPLERPVVENDKTGEGTPSSLPPGIGKIFFKSFDNRGYDASEISSQTAGTIYDKLNCTDTSYPVAWQLLTSGTSYSINATLIKGKKIKYPLDSIRFLRSDGTRLPFTRNGNEFSIQFKGRMNLYADAIWAVTTFGIDSGLKSQRWILGKINLINVDTKRPAIKIIPVNSTGFTINTTTLNEDIKNIFEQYGILPNLTIGKPLSISDYNWGNDIINSDAAKAGITYNNRLSAIIETYKHQNLHTDYNNTDTSYFFILNRAADNTEGYMRLGETFGFIFLNGSCAVKPIALAHEFGHGRYYLEHPFGASIENAGGTDNIMDYSDTRHYLNYSQWLSIHDPQKLENIKNSLVQKELEGKIIKPVFRTLEELGITEKGYLNFIQPNGAVITLHSDSLTALTFSLRYNNSGTQILSRIAKNSIGVLTSFNYKGFQYGHIIYEDKYFTGFFKGDNRDALIDSFVFRLNKTSNLSVYAGIETETCELEIIRGKYNNTTIGWSSKPAINTLKITDKQVLKTLELKTECLEYFDELHLTEDARKWWEKAKTNTNFKTNESNCRRIVRVINDLGTEYKYFNVASYDEILKKEPKYYKPFSVNLNEPFLTDGLWSLENYLRLAYISVYQQEKIFSKLTKPEDIFDVLVMQSEGVYKQMSLHHRIKAIRLLTGNGLNEIVHLRTRGEETVVVKLIKFTPANQADVLIDSLEQIKIKGIPLIQEIVNEVDDKFLGVGGDNYFNLMSAVTHLVYRSNGLSDRIQAIGENPVKHTIFWEKEFLDTKAKKIGSIKYTNVDFDKGKISYTCRMYEGIKIIPGSFGYDSYSEPVTYTFDSPFDLIIFQNESDVTILSEFFTTEAAEALPIVPAVFLKFSDDKTFNQYAMKTTEIATDVATIATGPGLILNAMKMAKLARYAMISYETASMLGSAANLTINLTDLGNDPEFAKLVNDYNAVIGALGIAELGKNTIKQGIKVVPRIANNIKNAGKALTKSLADSYISAMMAVEVRLTHLPIDNIAADKVRRLRSTLDKDWGRIFTAKDYQEYFGMYFNQKLSYTKKIQKLATTKSSSVNISWENIDDITYIREAPSSIKGITARKFAALTGENMYELILGDGTYVKMDLNNGTFLFGTLQGDCKAFVIISPKTLGIFKSSIKDKTPEEFEKLFHSFVVEQVVKLETILGILKRPILVQKTLIYLDPDKVSTFLGSFYPDMMELFEQMGDFKNIGLGTKKGQINILNMPDWYGFIEAEKSISDLKWWEAYNKKWMDEAIARGDDFYFTTKITDELLKNIYKNNKPNTIFAYELKYLYDKKIWPKNISTEEINILKAFFK